MAPNEPQRETIEALVPLLRGSVMELRTSQDPHEVYIDHGDFSGIALSFMGKVFVDGEEVDQVDGEFLITDLTLVEQYPENPGSAELHAETLE